MMFKKLVTGRYYVITDDGVRIYPSFFKASSEMSVKREDFTQLGSDYVCKLNEESLEVAKDIKLLERVASQKVFSKDKMDLTNWLQILVLVLILFTSNHK